jgi:Mrp family chromosome partitioning ATPase
MGKVGRRMGGECLRERVHPSAGVVERVPRAAVAGALQADRPLSVLALTPAYGGEAVSAHMRELARGFAARGERYRVVAGGTTMRKRSARSCPPTTPRRSRACL